MNLIGNQIIEIQEVDSTNKFAEELVNSRKFRNGTIIRAVNQTEGRGQGNNIWESEPGKNLTFSILLTPVFLPAECQFLLNKSITLGICDYCNELIPGFLIKWPNDIYFQARKIGGILMNHTVMGTNLATSIIGIGLNINQTKFNPDLPNPVSLIQILNHEIVLEDALNTLCCKLNFRYKQLEQHQWHQLDQDYWAVLSGFDQWSKYQANGHVFEGLIRGVDDFGRLLVNTREGETRVFNHREVEYL